MTNPKDALEWLERKAERERNMTNEEWLRSATTEQLAKIIYELMWHKEKYPELCVYPVVDSVVEWLKQPHTNE